MENEQTSKQKNISWIVGIILVICNIGVRESGILPTTKLVVNDNYALATVPVNVTNQYHRRRSFSRSKTTVNLMLIPNYHTGDDYQLWFWMPDKKWNAKEGDSVLLIGESRMTLCVRDSKMTDKVKGLMVLCSLTPEQWTELKYFSLQKVVFCSSSTKVTYKCQYFAGRNLGKAIRKIEKVKGKVKTNSPSPLHDEWIDKLFSELDKEVAGEENKKENDDSSDNHEQVYSKEDWQTRYYPPSSNKEKYEGEIKNGLPNGHGKIYYKNGEIFEGEFTDGVRNGPGKLIYPSGEVTEGIWLNGIRE